jgi:YidC/Oxa1 family membrane protein insertase
MELFNLLTDGVRITLYGKTFDVALNWIGNLIRLLIVGVGAVGIGIILFSVILKVIVLPFDVFQRITMRKQNLKMKENQAKMEKLQKQYANDKEKYNQKVMEMYKESGFSMCSSCLPMILSMIIFIVAINAFNAYSQYSNIENYNDMVSAYNARIEEYCPDLTDENLDEIVSVEGDKFVIKSNAEGMYVYYTVPATTEKTAAAINAVSVYPANESSKQYYIDSEKAYADAEIKAWVDNAMEQGKEKADALVGYFTDKAQTAVLEAYESTVKKNTSFLWIKNIWATDASYKHPVLEYADFKTEVSREDFKIGDNKYEFTQIKEYTNAYEEYVYNDITAKLSVQKDQANGYFILIVLSIGTILLQQFVSMRSQKEQQKYSSVDGQGASQQKMMMIIMTGMFAVFSFMYSSAFSIYMIMSNVLSLISTLIINKIVDVREKKKADREVQAKYDKRFRATNAAKALKEGKKDNNASKKK